MNVIFLDIDGVLNCRDRWEWLRPYMPGRANSRLDPDAVRQVLLLARECKANIVISSTWRIQYTLPQLRSMLLDAGFLDVNRIIGVTPVGGTRTQSGLWMRVERGDEIQLWLKWHPEVRRYVVLDDANDMGTGNVGKRLVQTTWDRGLEPCHVEAAKAMLTA